MNNSSLYQVKYFSLVCYSVAIYRNNNYFNLEFTYVLRHNFVYYTSHCNIYIGREKNPNKTNHTCNAHPNLKSVNPGRPCK